MTSSSGRGAWRHSDVQVRLRRRRLVHRNELVLPERFCHRAGISRGRLSCLVRHGELFSVHVGKMRYFPAVLADNSLDRHRLRKFLRRLPSSMSPIAKYLLLIGRRGSLGDKSPVQAVRRGKRFRVALRLADSEAAEVRLAQALRAAEESGPASRFDGQAFLRRKRATSAVPLLAR